MYSHYDHILVTYKLDERSKINTRGELSDALNYLRGGDRHRKPPWMDTRVLSRIKKKREAFEKYKQTREGKDYIEYTRARNAAKADMRRAVRDYEREIARQAKRNPKAFYRYVNGKLKTRAKIANLRTSDGKEISGDKERADEFNRFFSSVYAKDARDKQRWRYGCVGLD